MLFTKLEVGRLFPQCKSMHAVVDVKRIFHFELTSFYRHVIIHQQQPWPSSHNHWDTSRCQ